MFTNVQHKTFVETKNKLQKKIHNIFKIFIIPTYSFINEININ